MRTLGVRHVYARRVIPSTSARPTPVRGRRPARSLVAAAIGVLALSACSSAQQGSAAHTTSSTTVSTSVTTAPTTPIPTGTASTTTSPAATTMASNTTPTASNAPTSPSPSSSTCPAPASDFVTDAPGTGRTVALTFDDGPGPADLQYLQILQQFHVHATFFETGAHVQQHPDITRQLAQAGNLIANHSYDHDYPSQTRAGWTMSYLADQWQRTDQAISAATGQPVCFVRPPGGFRTDVLASATRQNLTAVLWSVDSNDWQQPGVHTTAATHTIVANATATEGRQHPIVLMHSAKASHEPDAQVSPFRGNSVAALPEIITWYQAHGYRFVTLDGRS